MATIRKDPFRGFNFRVTIEQITEAGFQECSGLDSQTEVIQYREGLDGKDGSRHVRKLRGLNTFTNLSLKRGITDSTVLWDWYKSGDPRSCSVLLLDEAGNTALTWDLYLAWPTKWTGPAFNSTGNSIAIESLDIAYEELKR